METTSAAPPRLLVALESERQDLLALLAGLSEQDWLRPTAAGHWRVRDVALHLLDGDLGWLSRGRDGDMTGLVPKGSSHRAFVTALDSKNQRWVDAAQGLSARVVRDLLAWSGAQVAEHHRALATTDTPEVISWAGPDVPRWLPLGRDLTERWVHQQQIREAVGRPGEHARYLPIVLDVFVWAFPHQVTVDADVGCTIDIGLGEGRWHLERHGAGWQLGEGTSTEPIATLHAGAAAAWRLLTGAPVEHSEVEAAGRADVVEQLLAVRSIIV